MPFATRIPEYRTWTEMKRRCYTKTNKRYVDYGGRGIAICPRWRTDFRAFLHDMGPKPTPRHSIERVNNDGPYSPDNCRWATWREQAGNKRTTHWITFNGERLHITEWARRTGLPRLCIRQRLLKLGWTIERALTEPRYDAPLVNGERKPIRTLAREHGLNATTVHMRLHRGMTLEQALQAPLRYTD